MAIYLSISIEFIGLYFFGIIIATTLLETLTFKEQ